MMKHLLKIVLVLTVLCAALGAPYGGYGTCWLSGAEAHAVTILLPQTGQTTSHAAGDDGAYQAAKPGPILASPTTTTAR